ncbi:MAG: hypothetical protein D6786_02090 [Gammaproteobacteria bacterium]|nr:MAG: hypothetical protein D6786_02090 [Gammaproteobacteria bacterium]
MPMKLVRWSLWFLLLALAGCGFHLRGQGEPPLAVESIYVDAAGAPMLGNELRALLRQRDIPLAADRERADVVITLSGEQFDRRVLSVDPDTGKAREFQIAYQANVRATRGDTELLPGQSLEQLRDYLFDETAVLGKSAEESQLHREILRESADTVLGMVRRALNR